MESDSTRTRIWVYSGGKKMKGDDIFDIPMFTDTGEINPALIQRMRQDFGSDDEHEPTKDES